MNQDIFGDLKRLELPITKVGDTLLRIESYNSAKEAYLKSVLSILGPGSNVPIRANGGYRWSRYESTPDGEVANLMACYVGIAQSEWQMGNLEEALLWLEEVRIIYFNIRFSRRPKLYDWTPWFLDHVGVSVQYARAADTAGRIFLELGNTASAVHRRWSATEAIPERHTDMEPAITRSILARGGTEVMLEFRHPDPKFVTKSQVNHPSLQVLGSWKKLKVKKTDGPGRRMGFTSFIWNGELFVGGGRLDSLGPFYRDVFYLDLNKLDGWKPVPQYPQPFSRTSAFLGWNMTPCVEHKKAYLFHGGPVLDFLDLTNKKWGSIVTNFVRNEPDDSRVGLIKNWPYPNGRISDSTQQIFEEKMYVLGGTHGSTNIGCNLFMVLDLNTREWRRLSGSVMPPQDYDASCPGPRKTPNSWIDPVAKRFYLIFGECDRMGAALKGELHGGEHGHSFDDFWSWDIVNGGWTRERMAGNIPCPRSEAACVYNPVLNKTIVWGGYNADMPTVYPEHHTEFSFSYFADTYVCDGTPSDVEEQRKQEGRRNWKQVLTMGFPTYRAQSQLNVDTKTGRTYLFGGFTNNDYVPSRKTAISRSFGDLWELRIDIPRGHFEGVDIEDETRTAPIGPWKRCFSCGSAGQWRKCGGSCGGRAFFCDTECQREGWKEHKAAHGCKRL